LAMRPTTLLKVRNSRQRCTPKRRESPSYSSTRCTTRCIEPMCWKRPTSAAARTAAPRVSMDRRSRTLRRTGCRRGWVNWRKSSETRGIVRRPCASLHSQAGRQTETVGDTPDQRSRGADGGRAGLGADLRGRSAAGAIRVIEPTAVHWKGGQSAQSAAHGTYGGSGRRLERLLR